MYILPIGVCSGAAGGMSTPPSTSSPRDPRFASLREDSSSSGLERAGPTFSRTRQESSLGSLPRIASGPPRTQFGITNLGREEQASALVYQRLSSFQHTKKPTRAASGVSEKLKEVMTPRSRERAEGAGAKPSGATQTSGAAGSGSRSKRQSSRKWRGRGVPAPAQPSEAEGSVHRWRLPSLPSICQCRAPPHPTRLTPVALRPRSERMSRTAFSYAVEREARPAPPAVFGKRALCCLVLGIFALLAGSSVFIVAY